MERMLVVRKYDAWYRISCMSLFYNMQVANGFTKSETPFLADFTSKIFFFLKNLNWLRSAKYHKKLDFLSCCCRSINPDHNTKAYSEPRQTFKIELFLEIGNCWKPFTILIKVPPYMCNRVLNMSVITSAKISYSRDRYDVDQYNVP